MENIRTLRVEGTGKLKLKPDTIELNITLSSSKPTYPEIMDANERNTTILKNCILQCGFEATDLKSSNFQVNPKYEQVSNSGYSSKMELVGYSYSHHFTLRFPIQHKRLSEILTTISQSEINPTLQLHFTIEEVKKVQKELLELAIQDAKEKAEILSRATKVKLVEINSIDFRNHELLFQSSCQNLFLPSSPMTLGIPMATETEPEELEVSESVILIWTIK